MLEGEKNNGQRKLNHHRAQGSSKNDHGRGGLQDLAQIAALEEKSGEDSPHGQEDAQHAGLV